MFFSGVAQRKARESHGYDLHWLVKPNDDGADLPSERNFAGHAITRLHSTPPLSAKTKTQQEIAMNALRTAYNHLNMTWHTQRLYATVTARLNVRASGSKQLGKSEH